MLQRSEGFCQNIRTFTASGMSVTAVGCRFTSDAISFGIVVFSLNLKVEMI